MKTTAHRAATLAQISADIRRCSEAAAWASRPADWRMDALERAGELALAGRLMDSRRMAEQARER